MAYEGFIGRQARREDAIKTHGMKGALIIAMAEEMERQLSGFCDGVLPSEHPLIDWRQVHLTKLQALINVTATGAAIISKEEKGFSAAIDVLEEGIQCFSELVKKLEEERGVK